MEIWSSLGGIDHLVYNPTLSDRVTNPVPLVFHVGNNVPHHFISIQRFTHWNDEKTWQAYMYLILTVTRWFCISFCVSYLFALLYLIFRVFGLLSGSTALWSEARLCLFLLYFMFNILLVFALRPWTDASNSEVVQESSDATVWDD